MTTIAGKIFYITGGTRGIGLAAARALAARGAHVLLLSRAPDADALAEVASARASADQRVAHLCVDVADRAAVASTIALALAEFGAPDVLIHGAAIGSAREFSEMEFEEFDRVMRVNLYGSRHLVEAVLPAMLHRRERQDRARRLDGRIRAGLWLHRATGLRSSQWSASHNACATSSSRAASTSPVSARAKSTHPASPMSASSCIPPRGR